MKECPFCHKETENVIKREMKVPTTNFIATSKQPMCDECSFKLTNAFTRQEVDMSITPDNQEPT